MSWSDLLKAFRELGALEKRTEDVLRSVERLTSKVDAMSDRLTRLEADQSHIRDSVKSEILGDIKADIVRTTMQLEHAQSQSRPAQLLPRQDG